MGTETTTYEIAGRTVAMPCVVRDASAGTAMFDVDAGVARAMVPDAFEVVESGPGRCQLSLAVIDYRDNDLGDYGEIGVILFVKPRMAPGNAGDASNADDDQAGTYIAHLPVDQAFTCEAGRTIWGFPKSVEEIDIAYAERSMTATLSMDGLLVLRLTLPRGGDDEMPALPMTTYTLIDGVPHTTAFTQGGTGSQVVAGGEGTTLELGDHTIAKELRSLGLPAEAQLTTWTEHMRGTFETPRPLA